MNTKNNDEIINTQEPIEISEEERKIVLQALEKANWGEGLVSHKEIEEFFDTLFDDYKAPPSK